MLVTQYNNTAVTRTTTIHEDLSSINISTLSDVQSTAFEVLTAIDPEYEANGFALNNGTNAFVDGTFSVAYPTLFIGIQGFEFITVTQQDPKCPKGFQSGGRSLDTVQCACMMQTYMDDPNLLENTVTSQVTLSSTYYQTGNILPTVQSLKLPKWDPRQWSDRRQTAVLLVNSAATGSKMQWDYQTLVITTNKILDRREATVIARTLIQVISNQYLSQQ